jgi:hypothetical protein
MLSDPVTVTSSGYESMLRGDDSDDVTVDGSSSTNQSVASECWSETKVNERRVKGTHLLFELANTRVYNSSVLIWALFSCSLSDKSCHPLLELSLRLL